MSKNLNDKIESLSNGSTDYTNAQAYIESEDKSNINYVPEDLEQSENNLKEAYEVSQLIARSETAFDLYNGEDYEAIVNKITEVISQSEIIYKASLMSELYNDASEKAQEEYDSKVEELTEQLKEQAEADITSKLKVEYEKTLSDKDAEIRSLEEELSNANLTIESLKKQLEEI